MLVRYTRPRRRAYICPQDDLRIDPDDIDGEMIEEIAERAGYSLDSTRDNPMYGRVQTVGDLVKFITLQPRRDKRRADLPDR